MANKGDLTKIVMTDGTDSLEITSPSGTVLEKKWVHEGGQDRDDFESEMAHDLHYAFDKHFVGSIKFAFTYQE